LVHFHMASTPFFWLTLRCSMIGPQSRLVADSISYYDSISHLLP